MPKPKKVKPLAENASNPKLHWKLVITKTGNVVAWKGTSGEIGPEYKGCLFYPSWTVFEETTTAREMKDLAVKYKVQLPGKCTKIDASIFIWEELCSRATEAVASSYTSSSATTPSRKKLSNRMYEVVHMTGQDEIDRSRSLASMTPQAKVCLEMLKEFNMDKVPESLFKEKIVEQAHRLNTRQDPWRIFQYYRGNLIRDKWIRLI